MLRARALIAPVSRRSCASHAAMSAVSHTAAESASGKKKKSKEFQEPVIDFPFVDAAFVDAHTHIESTWSALRKQHPTNDVYNVESFARYVDEQRLERFARFGAAINVNCEPASFAAGLALQSCVPNVYGAFGVHPHNATEYSDAVESALAAAVGDAKTVAVGEMGLDYFYMNSTKEAQLACFQVRPATTL